VSTATEQNTIVALPSSFLSEVVFSAPGFDEREEQRSGQTGGQGRPEMPHRRSPIPKCLYLKVGCSTTKYDI
jgi:hypothetical protein